MPRALFLRRMVRWSVVAGVLRVGSLAIGICGYHFIEGHPWIDALLNASMILGGWARGSAVDQGWQTICVVYALYSRLAIISVAGLLIAPAVHRMLHKFHLEGPAAEADPKIQAFDLFLKAGRRMTVRRR